MNHAIKLYVLFFVCILCSCANKALAPAEAVKLADSKGDILTFPSNTQRWLKSSLPNHNAPRNTTHIYQQGEIYVKDKWFPFTATSYYSKNLDCFEWLANIRLMYGVWVKAKDGHSKTDGWGGAKMWGIIPLGGAHGKEVLLMQATRSLAELAWLPHLALSSPEIVWRNAGTDSFSATRLMEGIPITITFELNRNNEIIRAHGDRFMDTKEGFNKTAWDYKYSDHKTLNGTKIPTKAIATYYPTSGSWEYFRVQISSLE